MLSEDRKNKQSIESALTNSIEIEEHPIRLDLPPVDDEAVVGNALGSAKRSGHLALVHRPHQLLLEVDADFQESLFDAKDERVRGDLHEFRKKQTIPVEGDRAKTTKIRRMLQNGRLT